MTACGTGDDGAMDPEISNPDSLDQADPGATTDPGQVADPGQPDPAAPRQATLPAPSISSGGSSTVTLTPSLQGSTLEINGGREPAAWALVTYQILTGAMRATAKVTINPAPGAAFTFVLLGTGSGYSSKQLRLERVPGSDALHAITTAGTGNVACGALPSGQPTAVTLAFDGTTKTFDVLLDGARTPCTDLPTRVSGPVNGFRMTDASNEGYGGRVTFTSFDLLY